MVIYWTKPKVTVSRCMRLARIAENDDSKYVGADARGQNKHRSVSSWLNRGARKKRCPRPQAPLGLDPLEPLRVKHARSVSRFEVFLFSILIFAAPRGAAC